MNVATNLDKYERGLLNEEETVEFFQHLIDSGTLNHLQGHYGRVADCLIDEGLCSTS